MTNLVTALFGLTKHVLGIYEMKEARKYLDRVIYLEKQYIKETSKDEENIDTNAIDHILIELQLISQASISFKK